MLKIVLWLAVLMPAYLLSQSKVTLSGTVKEQVGNETIIGATVGIPTLGIGTLTNEYGFFSMVVPSGTYEITVSFLGFGRITRKLYLTTSTEVHFLMVENAEELDEVVVTDDSEKLEIRSPQMSTHQLSIATIKKIPVILGEVDVIKALLLLPGVTNTGEASSGFNVRGGASDQNLILIDEATIYNSSHLFGFFSVFNPDAIKDIKLYKGGIPAKYGGRVSSVLDIYQKEGNKNKLGASGGIGLLSSRLLLEGPIAKNKSSFLVGGRSSYVHLFLPLFGNENTAYFYDLNTKINTTINENNSLFLSGYFGRDVFEIDGSFRNTYGNTILNGRWNHVFNNKLFSNLSLVYSDYIFGLDLDFLTIGYESSIRNYNIKYDLKWYAEERTDFHFGINLNYYNFDPGTVTPLEENSGINFRSLAKKFALELAAYIDVEQKLGTHLDLRYGLRLSNFLRLGDEDQKLYDARGAVVYNNEQQVYQSGEPIGSEAFRSNEVIASFTNLEPRLALSYAFDDDTAVKASYNRTTQYVHLISNTSSPTPLDVWAPSGKYIEPQIGNQVALGFFKKCSDNRYSLEVETYYKRVRNRIDYIDGADLIANDDIEQIILNGRARAYGLELLLRKNEGRFKGWVAYTLSRSEQQTAGRTAIETGINNGEWYKTPFDKLHDLSVTLTYDLNKKWEFSSNFILQSGQPVSLPNGQFTYNDLVIPTFSERNENRLPSYNRLDVAATLRPIQGKNRKWTSEWVFGLYNLYNRQNTTSLSFARNNQTGVNEATRLTIFGVVPSISYNFKF